MSAGIFQHSIKTAAKYPSIFSEPLKCAHHPLTETDVCVPTRLLNFGRIQKNERIITDPTLPTSSKANLWREGELVTDPMMSKATTTSNSSSPRRRSELTSPIVMRGCISSAAAARAA